MTYTSNTALGTTSTDTVFLALAIGTLLSIAISGCIVASGGTITPVFAGVLMFTSVLFSGLCVLYYRHF